MSRALLCSDVMLKVDEEKIYVKICLIFRNVFHAALTIAKRDGLLALQKGLAPALCYQFVMNGVRLGTYQLADKQGWTRKKMTGQGNPVSIVAIGAFAGSIASVVASPLYLVRRMLSTFVIYMKDSLYNCWEL